MVYILSLLTALYIGLSGCATYKFQNLTPEAAEIQREYFSGSTHIFTQMMSETPHQTPLFHFRGEQSGPRVLIIGGTHGNEPAGFEAAHRLVRKFTDTPLVKGEVFLIPEANKVADRKNKRRIKTPWGVDEELGNLNRCYPGNAHGLPMERMAFEITSLIREHGIDLVVDLHESPVFHLEYMKDTTNSEYHGLGQTLIYTPDDEASWITLVLLDEMNEDIPPGLEQFSPAAGPVQHSAAWSAGECHGIPGFTTETCKKLPLDQRIHYQMKMVDIILREAGIR